MNKKKLLALLMALVMTLTLVPVTVIAEELETVTPIAEPAEAVAVESVSFEAMNEVATDTDVAKIGNNGYANLTAAIAAATDGDTIELLKDVDATGYTKVGSYYNFTINKSITLDGKGHSIKVDSRGIAINQGGTKTVNVTLKNLTVNNDTSMGRAISTRGNIGTVVIDNVTMNCTGGGNTQGLTVGGNQVAKQTIKIINGSKINIGNAGYCIITFNPVDLTVNDSTLNGWASIYAKGQDSSEGSHGSVFTVTNSKLVSVNKNSGDTNAFSLIKVEDDDVIVNLDIGNTITIDGASNYQSIVATEARKEAEEHSGNNAIDDCVVNITGGNITMSGAAGFTIVNKKEGDKTTLNVSGGTFTLSNSVFNLNGTVSITGGTFINADPTAYVADGYKAVERTDELGTWDVVPDTSVAQIYTNGEAGAKFETLAEAIAAVPANTETTITMIGDETVVGNAGVTIPLNANIVLDLNGHTVKNAVNENKASQVITNNGTLTIKDSAGNGLITNAVQEGTQPGEWWSTPQYNYATNVIKNSGTLTVKSGTIRQTAAGSICYAVDNNSTSYDTILNVEGGTLCDNYGTVVRMFCNSKTKKNVINITGGEITTPGKAAIWTQLPGSTATDMKMAELNISGGSVSGGTYAWYDYTYGNGWDNVNYSFTGGQLKGIVETAKANGAYQFISGGLYSVKPDAKYICDGYAAMANDNEETKAAYPYKVAKTTVKVDEVNSVDVTASQSSTVDTTSIDAGSKNLFTEQNTNVSGVKLSTTNTVASIEGGEADKSGLQAVVDAAKAGDSITTSEAATAAIAQATSIDVDVKVTVTPTAYTNDDTTQTATFKLEPKATVTATKTENDVVISTTTIENVAVDNDMIDQDQDITVNLYTGFQPAQIIHRADDGSIIEVFSGSAITYSNGVATVTIHHFSTLEATATASVASVTIGETTTGYDSLAAAFAAVENNQTATIDLLDNASGAGIFVAANGNKNITLNLNGHTYTCTGPAVGSAGTQNQAFHLEKGNTITIQNGTITSSGDSGVKMLVQNYSDLTLNGVRLDGSNITGRYTLSTNNGHTVINDSTIIAKEGGVAFDVDSGWGNYASNSVEVTGSSVINGNVEVAFEGKTAGTPSVLTLTSGTLNGDIVMGTGAAQTTVTKANTFTQTAPEGYEWADNKNGTSTLKESATITYKGASLRRRVRVSDGQQSPVVVKESTDIRFTFEWKLPTGATLDTDHCVFKWSKDGVECQQVKMVNFNNNRASLVINGVPESTFETEITVKLVLQYQEANSDDYKTIEVTSGTRTVKGVADDLTKLENTNDNKQWIDYAKYLLGTYGIKAYWVTNDGLGYEVAK